jgi:hypothetical protein
MRGASIVTGPLQHIKVPINCSCIACIRIPTTSIVSKKHQHVQVTTGSCLCTSQCSPGASIFMGPFQDFQVPINRSFMACIFIPRKSIGSKKHQNATSTRIFGVRTCATEIRFVSGFSLVFRCVHWRCCLRDTTSRWLSP